MSFLASVTEYLKKQISSCSGSQFKIPVQHGGEVTVGAAGLLTSTVKKRRMVNVCAHPLSPFYTMQIPAQGMVPPTVHRLSHLSTYSR